MRNHGKLKEWLLCARRAWKKVERLDYRFSTCGMVCDNDKSYLLLLYLNIAKGPNVRSAHKDRDAMKHRCNRLMAVIGQNIASFSWKVERTDYRSDGSSRPQTNWRPYADYLEEDASDAVPREKSDAERDHPICIPLFIVPRGNRRCHSLLLLLLLLFLLLLLLLLFSSYSTLKKIL